MSASRRPLAALLFLLACQGDPAQDPKGGSSDGAADTASPTDTSPPDDPPCDCDDGLFCNGTETCDAAGDCVAGTPPVAPDDGDPCTIPTECDEAADAWAVETDLSEPACAPLSTPPLADARDYAYHLWPTNHRPTETWPVVETVSHFTTGTYGAAFDEKTGSFTHFGAFTDGLGEAEGLTRDPAEVDAMPAMTVTYQGGVTDVPATATSFAGRSGDITNRSQMIDGGRSMNRLIIPTVTYADYFGATGTVQIASQPRHLVITHTFNGFTSDQTARIVLDGPFFDDLSIASYDEGGKVVILTDSHGDGWLFAVYDTDGSSPVVYATGSGGIVAEVDDPRSGSATISLLIAPTTGLDPGDLALLTDPLGQAAVTYQALDRAGAPVGASETADWDPTLGAFRVDLASLQDVGAPARADFDDPTYHHWHGRHALTIETFGADPAQVPLALTGSDRLSWYVTGGVATLRDAEGYPTGLPVQISKNWHEAYPNNWYHFYALPIVPGGSTVPLELTIASSQWGDVYAASHAQLSLIGWSTAGGHWDESALGVFGESITYDPDVCLGRSMVDDTRPFLVDAAGRWTWTGNVGGADFLRYSTLAEPYWTRRVAQVRSRYQSPGPLLTDVTYAGVSSDGRIAVSARPQLVAGDDMVRTFVHLSYTFLDDVEYNRLAFYQVAADNYADNAFSGYAWGNADGTVYDGDVASLTTTGYTTLADRGIALTGEEPWVFLYNNTRTGDSLPERYGNVGFIVRSFAADIGGTLLDTPSINLYRTNNGGYSQVSFEVGLPYEDGAPWCGAPCGGRTTFIPAGSTVDMVLEVLVPPADASVYYGSSAWLSALDASLWNDPEMMLTLARDGAIEATASVGAITSLYPLTLSAAPGAVAATVHLEGGLGYRPLSVTGLVRHDGWALQRADGADWTTLDASSEIGRDDTQAAFDPLTGTWTLTWSLPVGEAQDLRVIWLGE